MLSDCIPWLQTWYSIMASLLILFTTCCFVQVESLYRQMDDNVTKYWASESKVPGDPIHTYAESKRFCESIAGSMPIGTAEEMEFLRSFLPLASYPYWLGQGEEFGTWADGSRITADYDSDYSECEINCGIHYQAGKLVKMSMDEKHKANIICKVVFNEFFFFRLLWSHSVQLSSDQIEVVWAADFARSFLTAGFSMGCMLTMVGFCTVYFALFLISKISIKCFKRIYAKAGYEERESEASEPLGTAFRQTATGPKTIVTSVPLQGDSSTEEVED